MRHQKKHGKFHKKRDQRKMLIRHLAENVIKNNRIKTTKAKAKAAISLVSKLITKAKNNNINSRRYALKFISPFAVKKLHDELVPKYKDRNGGYLRIIKLNTKRSDNSQLVILEFV